MNIYIYICDYIERMCTYKNTHIYNMCIYTLFKFCYSRKPLLIQGKSQRKVKDSHPPELKNIHILYMVLEIHSLSSVSLKKNPVLI